MADGVPAFCEACEVNKSLDVFITINAPVCFGAFRLHSSITFLPHAYNVGCEARFKSCDFYAVHEYYC